MKRLLCLVISVALLSGLTGALAFEAFGFDYIEGFSEGLAAARQDNLWGYVNEEGETAVPFIYREVSDYSEGLAVVRKDRYYGYIDKRGKEVIPLQYSSAEPFSEGLAVVKSDGKVGAINQKGETVIPFEYDYISNFSEGYAVVEKGGYFNFARLDGSLLFVSTRLQYALPFSSGVAYVRDSLGAQYYINTKGSQIFRADMDSVGPFSDGYAIASRGGRFYIMSANGGNVTSSLFEIIEEGEDGYFYLTSSNHRGFFDKSTKKVTISSSFEMLFPPSEGLLLAVRDGRYGFVDSSLSVVLTIKYAYAESFKEGLALVLRNELYGFINQSGETVIPYKYEEASSFNEGLSIVRVGRYYGCIDKNGNLVVPAEYGYIQGFKNGVSVAKKGGRYVVLQNPLVRTEKVSAAPSSAVLEVDGGRVTLEAFSIGGYNYLKLRDIAYILKDTPKKFNVIYNESDNSITLRPNEIYMPNGYELISAGIAGPVKAVSSKADVYLGDRKLDLAAYKIADSNYYKLRDIAELIGFSVEWNGNAKVITIDSSKPYKP